MNPKITDLIREKHPCFGEKQSGNGRVHMPVAGMCNIACRFCRRAFNVSEQRPGVAERLMTAEEAVARVGEAKALCKELTVAGIAGPGDALASAESLKALRLIHERYPELILCISTNGLLLPSVAEELKAVGVRSVTVTVNGVNPATVTKIVSEIRFDGKVFTGERAAEILIANQLDGIRAAKEFAAVKVNTVLIPGINDDGIGETARAVGEAGAILLNVIPLIPEHEFAQISPPDCDMLSKAREEVEKYLPVFRHCARCRADACGVPGVSEYFLKDERFTETFSHG
ncbi:MAG: radical SAM protein [Clostridiaceae bacterium]|jgi:nitrogen fixation protein NifB|nr:radical SAM protein [Clostridiaceae bacterium]